MPGSIKNTRHLYDGHMQDGSGRIIDDGLVSVYLAGTSTPANIYSTNTSATADIDNIISTDSKGYFSFWVDDNDYSHVQNFKIVLSAPLVATTIYDNRRVFHDVSFHYSSIMTTNEIFTQPASGMGFYELDPGTTDRNFTPSGTFSKGYTVIIKNVSTDYNIYFNSTDTITPGLTAIFSYNGTIWRRDV